MPKVSVIIPTYNRADLLARAVASVCRQTYHDLEIIVVDDGSTDDTKTAVFRFADPRIRYIYQENQGVAAARNAGIAIAAGEWIAFLDSDDQWEECKIEKQLEAVAHSQFDTVGFVSCYRRDVDKFGSSIHDSETVYRGDVFKHFLQNWMVSYDITNSSTVMVRRSVLGQVGGFQQGVSDHEDYDLWIRIAQVSNLEFVEDYLVLCYKWKSEDRMSTQDYFTNKSIFFSNNLGRFLQFPDILHKKACWLLSYGARSGDVRGVYRLWKQIMSSELSLVRKLYVTLALLPRLALAPFARI